MGIINSGGSHLCKSHNPHSQAWGWGHKLRRRRLAGLSGTGSSVGLEHRSFGRRGFTANLGTLKAGMELDIDVKQNGNNSAVMASSLMIGRKTLSLSHTAEQLWTFTRLTAGASKLSSCRWRVILLNPGKSSSQDKVNCITRAIIYSCSFGRRNSEGFVDRLLLHQNDATQKIQSRSA